MQEWLASLSFDDPDCPDLQLTMGAVIVEEMRVAVEKATGFRCSAGISHNKVRVEGVSPTSPSSWVGTGGRCCCAPLPDGR